MTASDQSSQKSSEQPGAISETKETAVAQNRCRRSHFSWVISSAKRCCSTVQPRVPSTVTARETQMGWTSVSIFLAGSGPACDCLSPSDLFSPSPSQRAWAWPLSWTRDTGPPQPPGRSGPPSGQPGQSPFSIQEKERENAYLKKM